MRAMKTIAFRVSTTALALFCASTLGLSAGCDGASSADEANGGGTNQAAGADGGAGGDAPCVPEPAKLPSSVPALLATPDGTTLVRHFHAVGTQNYRCTETKADKNTDATFDWAFVGPVADMLNSCGSKVGTHFAAPNSSPPAPEWEYDVDGSSVIGAKVQASPVAGSIPELLLKEAGHGDAGTFSAVSFVQRLQTNGGAAPPASDCNADSVDEERDVAYAAEYYFYSGGT